MVINFFVFIQPRDKPLSQLIGRRTAKDRLLPVARNVSQAAYSLKPTFLNFWQMFSEDRARHFQGEPPARGVLGLAGGYEGLRRCLLPLIC